MMKVEVLGTGCPKCKLLEENAKKALIEKGIETEVIKVTDINKIIEYGVMYTPALVINGEAKCSGRVADVKEIKDWLK